MTREDKIQKLLRHSFVCHSNLRHKGLSNCSCADNLTEFLTKDKRSIEWANKQKRKSQ